MITGINGSKGGSAVRRFPVTILITVLVLSGCLLWRREPGINVTRYGVRANATECQANAINAAINDLIERDGGGTLYFPKGKYYIGPGQHIRLQPGVNLVGAGIGKTIIWGEDSDDYLLKRKSGKLDVAVSHVTLENPVRLILMETVSNISFYKVEFRKGMVRFEKNSSNIVIDHCHFVENLGKAAYASDECANVTLTYNEVINPAEGGFNLSRHQNSYVAYNYIYSDTNIDSGYAGIRLPNSAHNNVVEHNEIIRMGRGIFILSSSERNVVENNKIVQSTSQGILIQSSYNTVRNNIIQDAGAESIYVVDATSDTSPTPSKANHNTIEGNQVLDTYRIPGIESERNLGLRIYGQGNEVRGNTVSTKYGRGFKEISAGNIDADNVDIPD